MSRSKPVDLSVQSKPNYKHWPTAMQLLLNLVGVLVLAKVVEPVWGSKGLLLFAAIVNFWTGFSTFVLLYLLYTVDRTGDLL